MDTFKVKLYEKGTNNHVGTRHHKTASEVQELKKQFKEMDLRTVKDPPPPKPQAEEIEVEEETNV